MRTFDALPVRLPRPLRTIPTLGAGLALSLTLMSCGGGSGTSAAPTTTAAPATTTTAPPTTAAPTTVAPTTTAAPAPATTMLVPPGCIAADPADVQRIAAGLKRGSALGEAFVTTVGPRKWINANIWEANGNRLSSADVWIIEGGTIYALSGSAREFTSFADGRKLPGRPSAGDDVAIALQDTCVVPSLRARNTAS